MITSGRAKSGFGVAALLAFAVGGCGGDGGHAGDGGQHKELPTAAVAVATIEPAGQLSSEQIVGTVESEQVAVIEAKISGTVASVSVRPGERVAAGQQLITLDAPEIAARRDQARAQFERARNEFEKFRKLRESEAVSELDFERVRGEYERARAALDEAATMLDYTTVSAPFDGIVARRMVDPGSQATPGRGLLVIEDPARLQFAAQVPEALVSGVDVGDSLEVTIDATGSRIEGEVIEVAPSADPASRTFLVKVRLPETDGLRSGQFGRVSIPVAEVERLTVPESALVRRGQLEMLFIAEDERARMRLVRSGRRWPGGIEIVSGLEPGERVVVEGAAGLRDGQPLDIGP